MVKQPMHILQINTMDIGGGAEKVAWNLFQAYRAQGHHSQLAVGNKRSDDKDIFLVPNDDCRIAQSRTWPTAGDAQTVEANRNFNIWRGYEDFDFPGTSKLLDRIEKLPDVIHCHNLHGDYFDLRVLPWMSQQAPVFLTLHDAWLLSGHCAHSFDCERWKTGCGKCPDLTIYPAVTRDASAYNWQRKKKIFSKSRLYVATPSRWLMDKVKQSVLAPSIAEAKVIPNGVDLSIFKPADKQIVRFALGIPQDAIVLLFTANGIQRNIFKDYKTMRAAVASVAENIHERKLLFIALGAEAPTERIGEAEVQFIPYQKDPRIVALYYQAADIYIHASHAEVWGLSITEALACGTPVIATSVGGIPDQVKDGATGFLTPPGDAEIMAARIVQLIEDEGLRQRMGQKAAEDAMRRFDIKRMAAEYLGWYQEILKTWKKI
jgi:glycosyltransferase involved in cell wall biosynthesis